MSRILWGILAIGAASYAIAAFALAPKARLNNLEGQALERATRHRERGDWDLAIAELEAAREAGAEGDILLASLGTAYLKMGEHDKATPLLAEGVAGLRQRKNPVGVAAVLVREASYALFSCYLREGSPELAWAVAEGDKGAMHPYVSRAIDWGYADLADQIIERRLSHDALGVPGSERTTLETAAIAADVERDDLVGALETWQALSKSLVQRPPASLEVTVQQLRQLGEAAVAAENSDAARERQRIARAEGYFRLGLRTKGLREITGENEPRDLANLAKAVKLQVTALGELGLVNDAIEARLRLLELADADVEAQWDLAQRLRALGRFEEAERALKVVLEREPHRGRAWLLMGDVQRRLQRPEAACEAYTTGIRGILEGSVSAADQGIDTASSPMVKALVTACENLADVAEKAGRREDELVAWHAILDLAYRPEKIETEPPANWLAERARYRVYRLTGEAPPPLPSVEGALGGMLFGGR